MDWLAPPTAEEGRAAEEDLQTQILVLLRMFFEFDPSLQQDKQMMRLDELMTTEVQSVEIVWNGTMDGDMTGPDGSTIPATGKSQTTPAVMVMTFKDGKVTHCNHYFDMMTMMVQLGLAG